MAKVLILFCISLYKVDTVYVSKKRYKINIFQAPFSVWIIPEEELSLNESLMKLPGITLLDYGNLSTVSVRGSGSEQVTVSLDGVPLNSTQTGVFDLSLIPSFFIEEGYVIGISSASLEPGGNTGGMVSFYSKEKERSILFSSGSFGKIISGAIYSIHHLTMGVYGEHNKNRYPYKDRFNRVYYRENAEYTHLAQYGAWNSSHFKLFCFSTYRDAEIPEKLGSLSGLPQKCEKVVMGSAEYTIKNIRVSGYTLFYSLWFKDTLFGTDLHDNISSGMDAFWKGKNIKIGTHIKREYVSSTKIGKHTRYTGGFDFLSKWKLHSLSFLSSLQLEGSKENLYLMSLFLSLFLPIKNNMGTYYNISAGYRYPTMNELYWPEDAFASGNPLLKSETEKTFEVGVRYISSLLIQAGGFFKIGRERIIWMQQEDGKYKPVNASIFSAWGGEINLISSYPIKTSFAYTLLFGKMDKGVVPYRPRHRLSLTTEHHGFYMESFILLKRPDNFSGLSFLEDIYLFNIGYRRTKELHNFIIQIKGGVKNILDKNYEYIKGYPLPGRRYEISLKIKQKEV